MLFLKLFVLAAERRKPERLNKLLLWQRENQKNRRKVPAGDAGDRKTRPQAEEKPPRRESRAAQKRRRRAGEGRERGAEQIRKRRRETSR